MQGLHKNRLVELNLKDMSQALGLRPAWLKRLAKPLMLPYAASLAHDVLRFDQDTGSLGLQKASAQLCEQYTGGVRCWGHQYIAEPGQLIVSNHPGLADTIALFSCIPHQDLKIIAADRPFLQALEQVYQKLIVLAEQPQQRTSALRHSTRLLQRGGNILTFPTGKIEADPYVRAGTLASVAHWAESLEVLNRLVPQLKIVVAIVAGVFHPGVFRHPLVRFRQEQEKQELSAAALQIALKRYHNHPVDIVFTAPITTSDLSEAQLREALVDAAQEALKILQKAQTRQVFR